MTIVDEIVDSPNVTRFYGVYKIGDHGVFIINRAKAKLLLGRKLSQQRKPTAYKRKVVLTYIQHRHTIGSIEIYATWKASVQ